jgi:hypothetical protein
MTLVGTLRTATLALVAALLFCASASAQNRKWLEPYEAGVKAFQQGKYAAAVALLERAAAANSKSEAGKIIEGVFPIDYFPFYYLGLAYLELGQFDKAQENLDKARSTLPRKELARLAAAESKIKAANTITPPPPPPRPPASSNAAFEAGLRDAETRLNGKQFEEAITKFDQLRASNPAEYAKEKLAAKRDEAVKGWVTQLTEEARTSLEASKYRDARAKLQQADQLLGGQKPVADLLAELKKRDDDYQRLKAAAQAELTGKNYAGARDRFVQAQTAQREQFDADNLAPRLAEASRLAVSTTNPPPDPKPPVDPRTAEGQRLAEMAKQLTAKRQFAAADSAYSSALKSDPKNRDAADAIEKTTKYKRLRDQGVQLKGSNGEAAQKLLIEARNADAARFEAEGLAATLDALTRSLGEQPATVALRGALLALLKGDATKSIEILEPEAQKGGGGAPLHAYLGVAYATRALSTPKPEDRTAWRSKAVEQFKRAKAAQPDYQLSERIVSPAILAIYQSARR